MSSDDPTPMSTALARVLADRKIEAFETVEISDDERLRRSQIILNGKPEACHWSESQWADYDRWEMEDMRRRAATDLEAARQRRVARLVDSGWPIRALESAQAADATKPAITRVVEWSVGEASTLVLSGPPGCGKTTAAARWALSLREHVNFMRAATFAASSRYDAGKRSHWHDAQALVLDDLGSEYADAKGNFLVDLDELIDTFYGNKRPLLITTNCSADDFKQRYGARIVDRLRECGSWFSVAHASLRRKP